MRNAENLNMSLNPMEMEDTLVPILQFFQLDGSFLKSVRFLSKLWNHVALKQFRKSNFLRIPPNFNSDFSSQDQDEKDAALSEIQIQEFLKRWGTIQNISISEDFSNDMKFFQSLEPPIQIQWEKITQLRFNYQFQTNALKMEKIRGSANFIAEMMTKCPNLKFLDIPPQSNRPLSQEIGFSLMKSCIKLEKNGNLTISNLAVTTETERDVEIVIEFSQRGVRVLNFLAKPLYDLEQNFPLQIPAVNKAFEKIIESNKNTLISLGLSDHRDVLLPDFEIPDKMSRMEILYLASDRMSRLKFKDGFQFHKNFPNLNQVNFRLDGRCVTGENHFWNNLFQNQQPCRTVKNLQVSSEEKVGEEIFQVFPAIKELKISDQVVLTCPEIFQFLQKNCKKLRILQLDALLFWYEREIQLVSNISGFPVDIVNNLMTSKMNFTSKFIDYFTCKIMRSPALSILKNLEQFDLIGHDEVQILEFSGRYMKFLQQHVFSSMPKLKVQLGWKQYL